MPSGSLPSIPANVHVIADAQSLPDASHLPSKALKIVIRLSGARKRQRAIQRLLSMDLDYDLCLENPLSAAHVPATHWADFTGRSQESVRDQPVKPVKSSREVLHFHPVC